MHVKGKDNWLKHLDFILLDILVFFVSFVLANLLYLKRIDYYSSRLYISILLCIIFPCVLIDVMYNPFSSILRRGRITEIRKAVEYLIYEFAISLFLVYILKLGSLFSRAVFILTYIIYLFLIIVVRIEWKKLILSGKISSLSKNIKSLLIVAEEKEIEQILTNINNEGFLQYEVIGLCLLDRTTDEKEVQGYPVLCDENGIYETAIQNNINEVFISTHPSIVDSNTVKGLIDNGIGIHLDIRKIYDLETDEQQIEKVGIYKTLGLELYSFTSKQSIYLSIKRIIDIFISLLVMIPLSIFVLIVKIAYLMSGDRHSIFFKQERVGQNGEIFQMYKFRTMIPNAEEKLKEILKDKKLLEEWNEYHKLKDDPRITKMGSFLRKTSLDELPQFINVLKGEMSLIGPRPLVKGELVMHNGLKLYERVKLGITGWWACNGRSNISYDERLELEYYYVKNCSLSLDFLTILRTIYVVVRGTGAE